MREEYAAAGPDVDPEPRAHARRSRRRLARGEQSLVLLNRRGFATAVFCRQCAGTLDCPNCSVSLVVHGEGRRARARCHYCNYSARVPAKCPLCAGPYLEQAGFGTERVEAEVRRAVPGGARRAAGSRRRPPEGRAGRAAVAVPRRRDRRARRHADDRQGPRLSARDARRRRLGRRRPRAWPTSARPSGRFSCSPRWPAAPAAASSRARRSSRRSIPSTTASSWRAGRTTPRSTSASCSSGGRCAIRRSCRSINTVVRGAHVRRRDGRCGGRRAAAARERCRARRACACSARRRRRSAGCAASTARSCSIKGTNRRRMREALHGRARSASRACAARRSVDVDPLERACRSGFEIGCQRSEICILKSGSQSSL